MNKKNDVNFDERRKSNRGCPKVPGSGKSIFAKPGKVDLPREKVTEDAITEDIQIIFDEDAPIYKAMLHESNLQHLEKMKQEILSKLINIGAKIDQHSFKKLVEAKQKNILTAEEEKELDSYLNQKAIDGSPIWRIDPPGENIEKRGEES